jgi:hypothetical protein
VSLQALRFQTFLQTGTCAAAAVIFILSLAGCSQPWSEDMNANAIACEGYGFAYGSAQYDACLKYVESRRNKRVSPSAASTPAPAANVICQTSPSGATNCQTRQ